MKVLMVPRGVLFFFPGNHPRENFTPANTQFSPFPGHFRSKPGHVPRCINRGVLQFLEPGHVAFEREGCFLGCFGGGLGCGGVRGGPRGGGCCAHTMRLRPHTMRLRHDHKTPSTVAFRTMTGKGQLGILLYEVGAARGRWAQFTRLGYKVYCQLHMTGGFTEILRFTTFLRGVPLHSFITFRGNKNFERRKINE